MKWFNLILTALFVLAISHTLAEHGEHIRALRARNLNVILLDKEVLMMYNIVKFETGEEFETYVPVYASMTALEEHALEILKRKVDVYE